MDSREALHQSLSPEWVTPPVYVEAARELMGRISLCPATTKEINETVIKADAYFDKEMDGLSQKWFGQVWLNPPYGKTGGISNAEIWSDYLYHEYATRRRVKEAVLLVNSSTGANWFQLLWLFPICFVTPRIKFLHPVTFEPQNKPTHYNAFAYFGLNHKGFKKIFSEFGHVVLPV